MTKSVEIKEPIFFINENREWGGGEKMFMWLSKKLYAEGYDIRYCMLYRNDTIDTDPILTHYLDFKFYNSYLLRNLWYFSVGTVRLARFIRKNNIKRIVCFGFNSFYTLGFLKFFMGFKLLVSERGDPKKKRLSGLRKILFAASDGAVFQTYGAKGFYDKNKEERSFVIPNPVPLPLESWNDLDGQFNVISVGRIDFEQKRQDLLVRAFSKVVQIIPSAKLYIAGSGADASRLEEMIKMYNIHENVELWGFQKDVISCLKRANVFVLSSDFEGIPNSLLEAMAFGMPVVSTDCTPGGAAMLIGDNENGILVHRNDADELAKGIIALLEDKEMRQYYAAHARKAMQKYDESMIISKWKAVVNKTFD